MSFIYDFINSALVFLYGITGNLGLTIIAFTAIVRTILLPLTIPSLRAQKQMRLLQPELKALKKKHGDDKKAYQQAQLDLYKKYNMNPIAGCVPQLVQLGLLIVLYHALTVFLNQTEVNGLPINTHFLWLDLSQIDSRLIVPILAGVTQLILSLMIAPGAEIKDEVPNDSADKKVQAANKKEEDMADMAASMQQQMLFIMPVMTGIFAARFPSGLGLYWIATTVFSIGQQYFISGPGGLVSYVQRAGQLIRQVAGGQGLKMTAPVSVAGKKTTTSKNSTTSKNLTTNELASALAHSKSPSKPRTTKTGAGKTKRQAGRPTKPNKRKK